MTQHNQEHLTITQLSAYLDQELVPDELALCRTHLQSCQPCQAALADLRLTSTLLHSVPQVEVPRAFVLPPNLAILPAAPISATRPVHVLSRGQYVARRTLRALSSIAAVIGVIFLLFGAFSSLPQGHFGAASTMSSGQHFSNEARSTAPQQTTPSAHLSQTQSASGGENKVTPSPAPTANQAATQTSRSPENLNTGPQAQMPPAFDLGQPLGRLSFGAALLLLGILGLLWTRRFKRAPDQ